MEDSGRTLEKFSIWGRNVSSFGIFAPFGIIPDVRVLLTESTRVEAQVGNGKRETQTKWLNVREVTSDPS